KGPAVLGCRSRVDADVAAASADIGLQCRPLRVVEHLTGRAEEHHGSVAGKVGFSEGAGVLSGVDLDPRLAGSVTERGHARGDGLVTVTGRLRENQDPRHVTASASESYPSFVPNRRRHAGSGREPATR